MSGLSSALSSLGGVFSIRFEGNSASNRLGADIDSEKRLFLSDGYGTSTQRAAGKYTNRADQVFRFAVLRFCAGVTARSAVKVTGVNRNSAVLFFHTLCEVIFEHLALETPELLGGEIEVDESYFGGSSNGRTAYLYQPHV